MDVLKLAILAFIAAGIVLAMMPGMSNTRAVLISGGITAIIMLIAIWRTRKKPQDEDQEESQPNGPTIK